jgi:hypothetical protein
LIKKKIPIEKDHPYPMQGKTMNVNAKGVHL